MKKNILSIILLGIGLGVNAQQNKIGDTGNVGIGTTDPKEKLTLSGKGVALGIYDTHPLSKAHNRIARYGNSLAIQNDLGGTWKDNIILEDNGNVGIGTRAPKERLHINGAIVLQGLIPDNMPLNLWKIYHNASNTADYGLQFWYNDKIKINFINDAFIFGGLIKSKEVKVKLDVWADYVFKKDYELPTLQQVESHIQQKGHLINIPSAAEVEQNGILLGEINAKLLEKIEELTLYTIAQEKQIKELNQKVEKNKNLENRLAILEALVLRQ